MALKHVSPDIGLAPCEAASPASCRFQTGHFNEAAVERILKGNPRTYEEHEAMREHQRISAKRRMETGKATPKPGPPNLTNTSRSATQNPNRKPRYGDEILYHTEIGFPRNFQPPTGTHKLQYSRHALEATLDDRYGQIPVLNQINVDRLQLVELGVQDRKVSKLVYRGQLDQERDMVVVVIPKPNNQPWFVKTVWINLKSDAHKTLNRSRYTDPNQQAA